MIRAAMQQPRLSKQRLTASARGGERLPWRTLDAIRPLGKSILVEMFYCQL